PNDAVKTAPGMGLRLREPFEAGRTEHAVLVLCDAFPAVKAAALRAPRNGLAHRMVKTALFREDRHKSGGEWSSDSDPNGEARMFREAAIQTLAISSLPFEISNFKFENFKISRASLPVHSIAGLKGKLNTFP